MGIIALTDFFYQIGMTTALFGLNVVLGIFSIPAIIGFGFTFILFLLFCCKDTYNTRKLLIVGCLMSALGNIYMLVLFLLGAIFVPGVGWGLFGGMVPVYLIPFVAWLYYRCICLKWLEFGIQTGMSPDN
jgi:hypothetical protein